MELLEELQTKGKVIDGVFFRREESYISFSPNGYNSITLRVGKPNKEFLQEEPIENCTDGLELWIAHNTNSKVVHKIKTITSNGTIEILDKSLLTLELLQNIADRINGKSEFKTVNGVKFNYTAKII